MMHGSIREHRFQISRSRPAVGLLPWGNVLEDILDPLGVSLESFCKEFRGSWMFGYVDALRTAGVRTVLICVSKRITAPLRVIHAPTGATLCVLPVSKIYRALHNNMVYPYGQTVEHTFGELTTLRRPLRPALGFLREAAFYMITPLKLLASELRRQGCDVILCQEYEYPRFDASVLLGNLLRMPVFATFQGGNYHHCRVETVLRPISMRRCNGLVIATQSEIQRVVDRYHVPPGKVARIFNPVDVKTWKSVCRSQARAALGISPETRVVAWHGRVVVHNKGLDTLLNAWERICNDRPDDDLRLLIIGTGDDAEDLQRRLTRIPAHRVQWVNQFVHDPHLLRQYLSAADIYAFPSRHEGFPVAPIEAMACGLPIVATDANGVPDILEGNEASGGVVVPRGDHNALAGAIGCLLDDAGWRCELGKRARKRAETSFSLEVVGEQLHHFMLGSCTRSNRMHEAPVGTQL